MTPVRKPLPPGPVFGNDGGTIGPGRCRTDQIPEFKHCERNSNMDYTEAENQIAQVQQQSQTVIQNMQQFAQKLRSAAPDETTGREWALDLREIAMSMQTQNQAMAGLVNQMAEYIKTLESQLATHPSPSVQPRGWAAQASGGGGFWSSVTSGLGVGAGFAVANDLVGDLFNMF